MSSINWAQPKVKVVTPPDRRLDYIAYLLEQLTYATTPNRFASFEDWQKHLKDGFNAS